MILAIDIGNTNIVLGEFTQGRLGFVSRLETDEKKTEDGYAVEIKSILELYGVSVGSIEGSIISSVVPQISGTVTHAVEKLTGKPPLVVGPGIRTGLDIRIDDPAQLGSDLVVDAVAAISKYPKPIIILDMGTATTISVVNKEGSFLGGVILAGIRVGLDALSSKAAQLPQIGLEPPRDIIGKNSIDSMKSGAVYGTASMIDGMVARIERHLGQKASLVATGGNSGDIIPFCECGIVHDANLLLEGLLILYNKNIPQSCKPI